MTRAEILYLAPYLISLFVTLGVFIYTWNHRQVRGAGTYLWFVVGQVLSVIGFIFELISPSLNIKILWDMSQWVTESIVVLAFFIFAIEITERKFKHPRLVWSLILILPFILILLLLTDNFHHLIYHNPLLSKSDPFTILEYGFTPFVYIYMILFSYLLTFYGVGLLLRSAFKSSGTYRAQFLILALGFSMPVLGSILPLLGITIGPQRDTTPITVAVGNMIVAFGLFRYGLFDLVPIAREKIMENMADPMIVLDVYDRVVDVNQAALKKVNKKHSEVEGFQAKVALSEWPVIQNHLENIQEQTTIITIKTKGETWYYELSISPLTDHKKRLLGHVIVVHDITGHKNLEEGYKELSEELEERVRERTEELRKTAERYRAVVENQTEFIVRWKPDGTRIFVNDAYCRYFEITPGQALSGSFMPLIVQEDRHAVDEKISRLKSGAAKVETDIYRVIRPDGSIGWQEWTDQAIHDESENLVEFQSVGRDITERKHAEEIILNQLAFDDLITKLLNRLSSSTGTEIDSAIEFGLQEIAKFIGVDHAYALLVTQDKSSWSIAYEWSVSPTLSLKESKQKISTTKLTWAEKKILAGEEIRVNSLDDLPPDAVDVRNFRKAEGALSFLNVPISGPKSIIIGFVGLDSHLSQTTWTDSDVTRLKIVGDAIANTLERKRAEENLADAYDTTLDGWARALELRDKETEGHSRRVTETTLAVARAMGFNEEELVHIRRGSILHDIGKMGIPDDILRKAGPLSEEERQIVLKHPDTAYNLLKQISYLEKALEIPYCHHEKWDGTGYPRGLIKEQIPLSARIFAVIDVWDALRADRPYRQAWDKEKVIQYLQSESGTHFDPHVLNIFLGLVEKGEI
jgi:PAS domain S-box-containing protein